MIRSGCSFFGTGARSHAAAAEVRSRPLHHETRDLLPNTTSALDGLTELAYHELRGIAHRHLAARRGQDRGSTTIDTTALVHEAYLKLASRPSGAWHDEAHFRAVASVAMRHILVDCARARATAKHGGGLTRVSLDDAAIAVDDEPDLLLAIDAALVRLAAVSTRLARLVELRFYGGLSEAEAAAELGLTVRTVQRDWTKARMLIELALDE
jgi:RNA polymerase sigma factor (TIGR02999 family)